MLQIGKEELIQRLRLDNPWWESPDLGPDDPLRNYPRRDYFDAFAGLVRDSTVRRAVVLIGPRRVGKTVMVGQLIRDLLASGTPGSQILYLSLETPTYTGYGLEQLLTLFRERHGHGVRDRLFVFFDEVQYLKDWERHLKSLVDAYPNIRFVVTGSAAAALKRKGDESGAGRFTDFLLPPLTFAEYLRFVGAEALPVELVERPAEHDATIAEMNRHFVDYLNYGGYPEAVQNEEVRRNAARFLGRDIVDRVLLRDLPSLYGIQDVQELNRLFLTLALNTSQEINLEALSKSSGVAKETIKKYIEYLEAAFLIRRVYRVDENAKTFQRQRHFKVYLTNPSMHAALFGPVDAASPKMGALVETAMFAQYFHHPDALLHYARWKDGRKDREVDLVILNPRRFNVEQAIEVKWSDNASDLRQARASMALLAKKSDLESAIVTTHTSGHQVWEDGIGITFLPSAYVIYVAALASLFQVSPEARRNMLVLASLPP